MGVSGVRFPIPQDVKAVTRLLIAWQQGDDAALDELLPIVHAELRRIAARCMAGERVGHSLQATALVNEAYLRLVDVRQIKWQDRVHFLSMAARLMRRTLVDYARAKRFQKRGGAGAVRVTFAEFELPGIEPARSLVALDDALVDLTKVDERKGRVVELRYFAGLTVEETAEVLNVSPETVMRDWKFAKAWLMREISRG